MLKIGGFLQAKMVSKDIRQKELADQMGLDQRTISNYCNDVNFPNLETLSKLCNILDIDIMHLLECQKTGNLDLLIQNDLEMKLLHEFRKIPKEKQKTFLKSIQLIVTMLDYKEEL